MNKSIYVFSGLGADERVFKNLDFSDLQVVHIKWIIPEPNETIEHYASRIRQSIITPNPVLIGYSFGGIMAIEVAKQIETEKIILIASAKTRKEIPPYYRFAGKLRIHRLLPAALLKYPNFFTNWIFGTKTAEDKQILKQILVETDPGYLKWAIDQIVCWKNTFIPDNLIHIHGTKDRVLPIRFVKQDITIETGGHLMTLNRAEGLSAIIRSELDPSS